MLFSALLSVLALQTPEASPAQQNPHMAALAAAVDLPGPAERRRAALDLARSDALPLEGWLELCRAFRPLAPSGEPLRGVLEVDLDVLGKVERTELHLHVPEALDRERPAPLLVALHGSGGHGGTQLRTWRRVAEDAGAILLCPTEAGRNRGFTGEPRERHAVLAAIRWVRRRFNVDENRIWLTGYSRGGILSWDLALRFPGVFAAVVPMAGAPRLGPAVGRNNIRFLAQLEGTRVHALAGAKDHPQLVWTLEHVRGELERAEATGIEIEILEEAGHSFDGLSGRGWDRWFAGCTRDPWAAELTLRAADLELARRSWVRIESFGRGVSDDFEPTVRVGRGERPSDEELRVLVLEAVDERTASLVARRDVEGTIHLELDKVAKGALLVREDWIDDEGRVAVRVGKRTKRRRVKPSTVVLLTEFVESFDRTFLPVARVRF